MINNVLNIEQKAEEILNEARKKASDIRARAESEVNEKLAECREKNKVKYQTEIEKIREAALKKIDSELEKANKESEEYFLKQKEKIDNLVLKVSEFIIIPEIKR